MDSGTAGRLMDRVGYVYEDVVVVDVVVVVVFETATSDKASVQVLPYLQQQQFE